IPRRRREITLRHSGARLLGASRESITTTESMDSGPAPKEAHPGMTTSDLTDFATSSDIAPMRRTPVYIICSPRPLVGKTLIARLLSEFLALQRGAVIAFDINLKEPSLLDYLPKLTETA